ncbi:MAG: TrkA C-terminal domain-containing protein [Dehalococcoidales bacterium]|nr:TrkA C-terminal domain-containing protein [Dehalococcoidales bacterium]MDZ4230646.1 TrkA C-terminal domain-containing protein [Dehalococcoidales bacterium]
MNGLILILPTLLLILASFLVVTAASALLMLTGMDSQRARFQALSSFTGTGFTTREAESVVNHPQRRRIVMALMMLGHAGIVAVVVTATSSVVTSGGSWETTLIFLVVLLYVYALYLIVKYGGITKRWEGFISKRFARHLGEEGTPAELLHLLEGYGIVRMPVKPDLPVLSSCVSQDTCRDKGLLVIGIERGDRWIPLPNDDEKINDGDSIVIYGSLDVLNNTFRRVSEVSGVPY